MAVVPRPLRAPAHAAASDSTLDNTGTEGIAPEVRPVPTPQVYASTDLRERLGNLLPLFGSLGEGVEFRYVTPVPADNEITPETEALRAEVRAFVKEHEHLMGFSRGEHNRDFSRAMARKGWIGMTWPKQYGGHERSAFERYVVIEEMLVAGAPLSAHYTGDRPSEIGRAHV